MKRFVLFLTILLLIIPQYVSALELVRQKNVATYIVFPLVDADGPVTGSANPDSEVDTFADGTAPDGFADLTNEATEIGTTGQYYLSLTQGEMNFDYIIIQIKSDDANTQTILIRTVVGDPLLLATTDDGGTINVTGGAVDTVTTTTTATTASTCTAVTTVNGLAANVITAASIATDAIGADELAADGATEIIDNFETQSQADPTGFHVNVKEVNGTAQTAGDVPALVTTAQTSIDDIPTTAEFEARTLLSADYTVVGDTIAGVTTAGTCTNVTTVNGLAANVITAASIATDAIGAAELAADAATEIIDNFETQSTADPTTFRVNVMEIGGTAQTANDNGADINAILTDTSAYDTDAEYAAAIWNADATSYQTQGTFGQCLGDPAADADTIWGMLDGAATVADVVNEWETQSQADPTGFHVNVKEINGTAQTANDNGADINSIKVTVERIK